MHVTAIVAAAGRSVRFGGPKLVALVGGVPLVDRAIGALLESGAVHAVVVVVNPATDFSIVTRLSDARVHVVVNADPDRGMLSSIQIGLSGADASDLFLVLPGDMPFVRAQTIAAVVARAVDERDALVVPVFDGQRGHPVAIPGRLRDAIVAAAAAGSLKDALAVTGIRRVELPVDDAGILRDVDVPADLSPG